MPHSDKNKIKEHWSKFFETIWNVDYMGRDIRDESLNFWLKVLESREQEIRAEVEKILKESEDKTLDNEIYDMTVKIFDKKTADDESYIQQRMRHAVRLVLKEVLSLLK